MAILENERFVLEPSAECSIPGYLILRLKGPETSLAELSPENARSLGEMLAKAARAVEQAVNADRVYVLSFCEADRRLHFHLFPRTAWLLEEYFRSNDGANEPPDGPRLFSWARRTFASGSPLPAGTPGKETVSNVLRGKLAERMP